MTDETRAERMRRDFRATVASCAPKVTLEDWLVALEIHAFSAQAEILDRLESLEAVAHPPLVQTAVYDRLEEIERRLGMIQPEPPERGAWRDFRTELDQAKNANSRTSVHAIAADMVDELDRVRSRLPAGMERCTILARTCPMGHSWLTAKNWVDHPCPTCERDELAAKVRFEASRYEDLLRRRDGGVSLLAELRAACLYDHVMLGVTLTRCKLCLYDWQRGGLEAHAKDCVLGSTSR